MKEYLNTKIVQETNVGHKFLEGIAKAAFLAFVLFILLNLQPVIDLITAIFEGKISSLKACVIILPLIIAVEIAIKIIECELLINKEEKKTRKKTK